MASIQLDTVIESNETAESFIAQATEGTQVTGTVVDPHGPGGGNPILEWTGPASQLVQFVRKLYGDDGLGFMLEDMQD